MSQKSLASQFRFDVDKPIFEQLRGLMLALDDRLEPLEALQPEFQDKVDAFSALAIERIDEVITPVADSLQAVARLGILFEGKATDTKASFVGAQTWSIRAEDRERFAPAGIVAIVSQTDPAVWMSGRCLAYDRQNGQLTIQADYAYGTTLGTRTGWSIYPAAGYVNFPEAGSVEVPVTGGGGRRLLYGSITPGYVPVVADIPMRTIFVNWADGKLYWRNPAGTIKNSPALDDLLTSADRTTLNATIAYVSDTLNAAIAVNTTAIGKRLRFDAGQVLADAEATQALTNLRFALRIDQVSTLTAAQKHNVRFSVGLAPWDLLGFKNIAYNARLQMSQTLGNTSQASVNGYVGDGHLVLSSGIVASAQRVAAPFALRPEIPYGLRCTITTAKATGSLATYDYLVFSHRVEGTRMKRMLMGTANAKNLFFGVYVAFPQGTWSVSVLNGAGTRSCVQTFTVAAGVSEQFVPLIYPGDTAGTWVNDTGLGMEIKIALATGPGYQTGLNGVWQTNGYLANPAQTNGAAVAGTTFTMSDLFLIDMTPGLVTDPTQVVPLDRLPFLIRPDEPDADICYRYLWVTDRIFGCSGFNGNGFGTSFFTQIPFPGTFRMPPSATTAFANNTNVSSAAVQHIGTGSAAFRVTASGTANQVFSLDYSIGNQFDSRL